MGKYDYDKIANELFNELEKCVLTEEQEHEVTNAGAVILVKSIEKKMRWKKNYSQGQLKVLLEKGRSGRTNIGWSDYWGRILENGSIHMQAQPHLRPGVEDAQDDALNAMTKKLSEIINR